MAAHIYRARHWPTICAPLSGLQYTHDGPDTNAQIGDALFHAANVVVTRVTSWTETRPVAGYHGTRLVPNEIAAVRGEALRPLVAASRTERLPRACSRNIRIGGERRLTWKRQSGSMDQAIMVVTAKARCQAISFNCSNSSRSTLKLKSICMG